MFAKIFGSKKSNTKMTADKTVHISQSQEKHQPEQVLMLLGTMITSIDYYIQVYNFTKKKWSPPQKVTDIRRIVNYQSSTLNNKLYYMTVDGRYNLEVFNPSTKDCITRLSYPFVISEWSTMCACNRFLYFCGGGLNPLDQVLRYDPQANSCEILPPMKIKRYAASAIFFQDCLYVLGGTDGANKSTSVEKYDPVTRTWTTLPPMREGRSFHATAILNGKLYACGGYPTDSVEFYDPAINSWQLVSSMNKVRSHYWVIAHEGMLYAIGGDDDGRTIEAYDPIKDQWLIQHDMSAGIQLGKIRTFWFTKAN